MMRGISLIVSFVLLFSLISRLIRAEWEGSRECLESSAAPRLLYHVLKGHTNLRIVKNGGSIGMPLEEFTEECWEGLVAGKEEIPVGRTKAQWGWEEERGRMFGEMVEMMRGGGKGK
jgi:hypothetical protein